MKTQVRLNLYERGIVFALIQAHGCDPEAARQLVVQYIEVIRKLGGYDSCEVYAERLVEAQKMNVLPEAWLERIRRVERDELRDKTASYREHGSEYAHV